MALNPMKAAGSKTRAPLSTLAANLWPSQTPSDFADSCWKRNITINVNFTF